jgi:hypothetical protein
MFLSTGVTLVTTAAVKEKGDEQYGLNIAA